MLCSREHVWLSFFFFIINCQQHFIFSFQHPVLWLPWPFSPGCQRAGFGVGHAEAGKCLKVLLLLSDDSGFLLLIDVPYGPNRSGQLSGQFELFSRAASLLGGRGLPGEQDKLGGVLLEPLHVGLQGLHALVPAPRVHRDPNDLGHLLLDAGHPKLLQAEAPAGANLHVVPDRRASHHQLERTGRGALGNVVHLGLPGLASTDLAAGWLNHVPTRRCQPLWKWGFRIMPFRLGAVAAAERPPLRAHGREGSFLSWLG